MPPKATKKTGHQKDSEEQEVDIVTLSTKEAAEIVIQKTQTETADITVPTTTATNGPVETSQPFIYCWC